jgi:hypothetical protein
MRPEEEARLFPGDESNGSAVDESETLVNLLPPGFFRGWVNRWVQAADQRVDQRGARFGRQGKGVSQHFRSVAFHGFMSARIYLPKEWTGRSDGSGYTGFARSVSNKVQAERPALQGQARALP